MLRQLLLTVGVPVLLSSVILLGSAMLYIFTDSWRPVKLGGAIAFGFSFFVSFSLINGGVPGLPPVSSVNWLPYFALAAAVLSMMEAEGGFSWSVRWGLRLALLVAAGITMLLPVLGDPGPVVKVVWVIGLSAVIAGIWWQVDRLQDELEGFVLPLIYLCCTTFASVLCVLAFQYASMAQYIGVIAALCGVFFVFSFLDRSRSVFRGAHAGFMLLFPLMLLSAWFLSANAQAGSWPFLALAVLPVLVILVRVPVLRGPLNSFQRNVCVAAVVVAIGLLFSSWTWYYQESVRATDPGRSETYDDYGY